MLASLAIRERFAKNDKSATAQSDYAATLGNVGMHYRTRGQLDASEERLLRSNEIWSELLQNPENSKKAEFQSRAAQARYLLGNLYFTRGDLDQAEKCYRESIERYEALADASGQYVHFYRELPGVVGNLTQVYFSRSQHEAAESLLRDALARQERFVREQPSVTQHRYDLGSLLGMMSQACYGAGKLEDAANYSRQATTALKVVVAAHPDMVQYDEAQAAYREGIATIEALATARPELLQPRIELAALCANLGNSFSSGGNHADALDWLNRAQTELDGKLESSPRTVGTLLANIHLGKSRAYMRTEHYQDAVNAADAGLELDTMPQRNALLMEVKCEALARSGKSEKAFELAMKLNLHDEQVLPEHTRRAGSLILLAAAGIQDESARTAMVEKGIALLRTAPGVNRAFLEELAKEPALATIVNTPEFQALLSETADP
jgi:tetratricopeptide (TPR) repeat protein